MPRLFAASPVPSAVPRNARGTSPLVKHAETVCFDGRSSQVRITCRSEHLHAHWTCDCGATGISTPHRSVESAREAAYAAVGRHHLNRHASQPTTACARA